MPKDKRKLAAIMFVDIVGYSRMMASNEQRTLELLKDFENICSPIISDNEGYIIKKVGDELFCEFSSAKEAVDCALAIQKAIQPYNDSRPKDFKLQVRIGIHIGDVVRREDGDIHGDGVNVASRIQPFANPGGICVSNAVRDTISSHPDYNIISEGQQELKNIIEKHTLYKVETGFEEKNIDKKKSNNKSSIFLIILGLCLFTALFFVFGWNLLKINNQTETPITKKELDAEKTRILVPHLGSRNEIAPLLNEDKVKSLLIRKHGTGSENPSDYTLTPFSLEEQKELYDELITKINTTFFPENIIYTSGDIEKAFERKAQMPPDFTTFPSMLEEQLLPDSARQILFEPFNYFIPDTLNKIIEIVGDNEYANHLIFIINGYNISPSLGYIEKAAYLDVLYKKVYDIYRDEKGKTVSSINKSSTFQAIYTNQKRFIPDIIDLINKLNQKYSFDEFIAEIESVNKDKIFIKMQSDRPLLKNTELYVMREYIYQDSISIQNRMDHINNFLECCNDSPNDADCLNKHAIASWNQKEYDNLINNKHHLQSGQGSQQMGIDKIILIEDVYDSIAVGIVIQNKNTCVKLLPGDLLKLNK